MSREVQWVRGGGWEMRSEQPQRAECRGLQAGARMQEFLLNEWEMREGLSQGHDMF